MAYREFPASARKSFVLGSARKTVSGLALSVCLYTGLAAATGGDRTPDLETELPPPPSASLSFEAGTPIIVGSVASMFDTPMFTGPNRSEKMDRAAPRTDIVAFTESFDAARLSIASARANGETFGRSAVAVAGRDDPGERISVASVDASLADAAGLRAIDELEGGSTRDTDTLSPASVPETLAYGRANTPATDFTPQHDWSDREQWCLATGIYFEARGENYRGQVAVAQVIMNRVEHDNYPDTICGVVYQNQHRRNACQFSFACDGKTNVNRTPEVAAWASAQEITADVLNEEIYLPEVGDATHYHATYVRPRWARNMDRVTQIGLHIFYRFKPGWRFGDAEFRLPWLTG